MILHRPSQTEQKLLVLYATHGLRSATSEQLLRFFVEQDLMNYIDLQIALAELRESGFLMRQPHPLGVMYQPTAEGDAALAMFLKRIPFSSRSKVDSVLSDWRDKFSYERHVFHKITPAEGGEADVRLVIMEESEKMMELSVRVPDMAAAELIRDRWSDNAAAIYARIMNALAEPISNID